MKLASMVVRQAWFHHVVLVVIIANAILAGVETSASIRAAHGPLVDWLQGLVQAVFVVEIALRLAAHWPHLGQFLRDGWNVFDAVVVLASLLPEVGVIGTVARLARLLRVARLVSAFPELRLIVETTLRSIPSLAHVLLLLFLILYVYAILGHHLFGATEPETWGSLGAALLTLFQVLTLEGWVELQGQVMKVHSWAWVYFLSFVVVAVFVVVNLFIALVINNLESAKAAIARHDEGGGAEPEALLAAAAELRSRLEAFERSLGAAGARPGPPGLGAGGPIADAPATPRGPGIIEAR
jgi:voltage-gated sodium channel